MSLFDDLAKNTWTPSLLGNIGREGYKGNKATQESNQTAGLRLTDPSELEKLATGQIGTQYDALRDLYSRGPGAEAVDAANAGQNSFIDMLRKINANGGMPTAEDTRQAGMFADQLFAPQQEALNQSFIDQNQQAARLSAQLNRPINDPIIQAKLRQEQMRQSAMLNADRTSFTAQEARNSPFRRLELQGQLADAQQALASQAMANRMQLMNMGNALQSQERNWRLQTAERYGNSSTTQTSGGGITGALGSMTGAAGNIIGVVGGIMSMGATGNQNKPTQPTWQGGGSGGMSLQTDAAYGSGGFMSAGGMNSSLMGTGNQNRSTIYDTYANSRKSRLGLGANGGSMFGGSSSSLFGTGRFF